MSFFEQVEAAVTLATVVRTTTIRILFFLQLIRARTSMSSEVLPRCEGPRRFRLTRSFAKQEWDRERSVRSVKRRQKKPRRGQRKRKRNSRLLDQLRERKRRRRGTWGAQDRGGEKEDERAAAGAAWHTKEWTMMDRLQLEKRRNSACPSAACPCRAADPLDKVPGESFANLSFRRQPSTLGSCTLSPAVCSHQTTRN